MGLYAARSGLGLTGILLLGLLLTLLTGGTVSGPGREPVSSPLLGAVNFIADIGPQIGWLVLPVTALWLLIRRLPTSAMYVVVAATGSAVLTTAGPVLASWLRALV